MRKEWIIVIIVVMVAGTLAGVVFYRNDALKEKIAGLEKDKAGFQQQSAESRKRIKSLEDEKEHVVRLENLLKEKGIALDAIRKDFAGLQKEVKAGGKIRASLEEQVSNLQTTRQLLADAEQEIQRANTENDKLAHELKREKETGQILKNQLAETHDSILAEQVEFQNKQNELESAHSLIAALKDEVQKNDTVKAILEKEISGVKGQLLDLKDTHGKIQVLQTEIQKTTDINLLLKNQISILQLQLKNYQEKTLNDAGAIEEKESKLKQIVSSLNNCLVSSKDVESSLQLARSQIINLKGMVEQARAEQIVMGKELTNLETEKAEMARRLTEVKQTYEALVQELHDKISSKEAVIKGYENKFSVTFINRVLFHSGKTSIMAGGQDVLRKAGDILGKMRFGVIRIAGHTDNRPIQRGWRGRFPTNWELSVARAAAVARFFQTESRIAPEKMEIIGFGSSRPVASNTSREGRAKNRRVEITIAPVGPKAKATP